MIKVMLSFLIFGISMVPLTGQDLDRLMNGSLAVDISELTLSEMDCPFKKMVTADLFKKVHNEDELACSKRNTWDKIESVVVNRSEAIRFSKMEKGIYKAALNFEYDCSPSIGTGRKITQVFESNILNDRDEKTVNDSSLEIQTLYVFPNPSFDKFIVQINSEQFGEDQSYDLKVYTSDGSVIQQRNIDYFGDNRIEIDLGDFPAGQYTISVSQDDQPIGTSKVFKISK